MVNDMQVVTQNINLDACVTALENSSSFSRTALYIEIAVSLSIFTLSPTGADKATKRSVMEIYRKAGFDVDVDGDNYKTVNRRINTFAELFKKIGRVPILQVLGVLRDGKAIDSIKDYLVETYKFSGINAVLQIAGKPVKQNNTPKYIAVRRKEEPIDYANSAESDMSLQVLREKFVKTPAEIFPVNPDATIISWGMLDIVVPKACKPEDIRRMASQLMVFAEKVEEEERE